MASDQSKPRRGWFRFSLRSMLLALTLLCIWLGILASRASDQRQAVAAIRALGGRVLYDYQMPGSGAPNDSNWLRGIMQHDFFANVVFVGLIGTDATNADLVHLQRLRKLEGLSLVGTDLTDESLAQVAACTNLKTLDLRLTETTDAGLVHLQRLVKLQSLDISLLPLTPEGVDALRKALPNAQILRNVEIFDPVLIQLRSPPVIEQ